MNSFKFRGATRTCTISAPAKPILLRKFEDFRGVDCIISVANTIEDTILIGCERPDIQRLVVGEGMQPVYIAPPYTANTQMNLDREMVIIVIEVLGAFLEVTKPLPTFDDLETTIIIAQPELSESSVATDPLTCGTETTELPEPLSHTQNDEPESIPALEMAKAIKDTQEIIDRLTINRLQKALVYLMVMLSGICIGNWTTSELIKKAIVRFDLNRKEARQLRKMYRVSTSPGTPR
jgi:hypothetical protein